MLNFIQFIKFDRKMIGQHTDSWCKDKQNEIGCVAQRM